MAEKINAYTSIADTQIAEFTPPPASAETQPIVTAPADLPIPEPGDPIARITMKTIRELREAALNEARKNKWTDNDPYWF